MIGDEAIPNDMQDALWSQLAGIHPGDRSLAARIGRRLSKLPGRWRWSIERFLRWWLGELARALPLDRGDKPQPVRLSIDEGRVLTAETRVAVESLPMIDDLLALEVEELTPFSLDQVTAAYRLEPAGAKELTARVHVVPVRIIVEAAERAGLDYDAIDVVELAGEGGPLRVRLPRPKAAAQTPFARAERARHRRLAMLGGLTLLLVAAALWLPLTLRRQAIAEESAALAAERATLRPALARISRDQALTNAAQAATANKLRQPMMIDVLRRLTQILGDDVSLSALRWEDGTLTLSGVAPDAAKLIGLLDADPMFDQVHLVAPVAVDRADGRQRFEMAMSVATRRGA